MVYITGINAWKYIVRITRIVPFSISYNCLCKKKLMKHIFIKISNMLKLCFLKLIKKNSRNQSF